MLFTRIPQQYAPLGGELRYAVSQETAGNIDIRIVDSPELTTYIHNYIRANIS